MNNKLNNQTRILNQILAEMYLVRILPTNSLRDRKTQVIDQKFNLTRPSINEMHALIEDAQNAKEDLGSELCGFIIEELILLDPTFQNHEETISYLQERFEQTAHAVVPDASEDEKEHLYQGLLNEILGFGPLEPLLNDPNVLEIFIDSYDNIYVERQGKFEDVSQQFNDVQHLLFIMRRILRPLGMAITTENPVMDARLPDGSRVNIILPPIAMNGPSMVIRLFPSRQLTLEDLYKYGSVTPEIADFIKACVQAQLNIIVAGGTGSGKTTILNIVTEFIEKDERVVTIENAAEMKPRTNPRRTVRMESRPADSEGKGEITMSDLVINALKMRPDRIILGEARADEVIHFIQAINTGHDGSMLTLHASNPRDVMARLETMAIMSNPSIPLLTIRQQMASGFDLIVHTNRLSDGSRKIVAVSEVVGMQGDTILLQDIFVFEQSGVENGRIQGKSKATGYIPTFLDRLQNSGIDLPITNFTAT